MLTATDIWSPSWVAEVTGGAWQRRATGVFKGQVHTDSRACQPGDLFVAIKGTQVDGHAFANRAVSEGAWAAIVETDIDLQGDENKAAGGVLRVNHTRTALADLARAWRRCLNTTCVIVITGSSGKTTTKDLLHHVLKTQRNGSAANASFNNDLGVPLTILKAAQDDEYLVLELGTNAPGEIADLAEIAQPSIAAITMIGQAHLAGLGSQEAIAQEKLSLLNHVIGGGLAIVPCGYASQSPQSELRVISFGSSSDADVKLIDRGWDARRKCGWFDVQDSEATAQRFPLSLPGAHNAMNAVVVVALAREIGLPDQVIATALASAQPSSMRFEMKELSLGKGGKVTICNDAYNANPDSMIASVACFLEQAPSTARLVVMLGDMLELGSASERLHAELGNKLIEIDPEQRISQVICVGPCAATTAMSLTQSGRRAVSIIDYTDADLIEASRLIGEGDWVLLKGSRGIGLERVIDAVGK